MRQHQQLQGDIVEAAFFGCPKRELSAVEARIVASCNHQFPLRNVKLALSTARGVPFDELLDPDDREAFLRGLDLQQTDWRDLPEQARLKERRFREFLDKGGDDAVKATRFFVERAIPKPQDTELGFWSVSILPQGMLRLNAGQQEVFTAQLTDHGTEVRVLTAHRVRLIGSWRMPYQLRSYANPMWAPKLASWLTGRRLLSARALVVRLMRHTQALNSGSHCPQVLRANLDERPASS
nr:hypothetical protein [uncultured Sphingomonas sp.]